MNRFRNKECQVVVNGFNKLKKIYSREEEEKKKTHLSQGLLSQISALCSCAHYKISMVEDALISPISEYEFV